MNILNPVIWLYGALAVALVFGSGYQYGRTDGKKIERGEWQAKEKKADDAAAEKLKTLTDDAIKKEQDHADALAVVSKQFQQEIKNERIKKDRIIADVRAGTIRLRDPNGKCAGVGIALPETTSGNGKHHANSGADLPSATAEFLLAEASRADEIVRQLTACQAVVAEDRRRP